MTQKTQLKKVKHRKHKPHTVKKTIQRAMAIMDIFEKRTNVIKGLTKDEFISLYLNKDLKIVLRYNQTRRNLIWCEIIKIKKYLRKKGLMAIISKRMNKGFELIDDKFGRRELESPKHIFFSCTKLDDAWNYRSILDKLARGQSEAGEQAEEIARNYDKKKKIIEVVNK